MRLSLRTKLTGFVVLIILVVGNGIGLVSTAHSRARVVEAFRASAEKTTSLVAQELSDEWHRLDMDQIRRRVHEMHAVDEEIVSATLLDVDGRTVFMDEASSAKGTAPGRLVHTSVPVVTEDGKRVGTLSMGFTLEPRLEALRGTTRVGFQTTWVCLLLGAVLAMVIARKFSRPILLLARATDAIGRGDVAEGMRTPLPLERRDEIGQLARSVDRMARQLAHSGALLQAVADCTRELLLVSDFDAAAGGILETIGRAADADRAYLFQNHEDPATGRKLISQRFEWCREGVSAQLADPECQDVPHDQLRFIAEPLSRGDVCTKLVGEIPEEKRALFANQGIRSMLLIPIMVRGEWWGLIGFDDCRQDRRWTEAEVSALSGLAGALGAAVSRCAAERKLETASLHDALTGLPNRVMFTQRAEERLKLACTSGDYGFAVMFLDLDRFKVVNDTLGHAAGDALLKQVARRLVECLPPSEGRGHTVARLGGDEFTVLLDHVPDAEHVSRVARRILHALEAPHQLLGHEVVSTASIGIAVAGEHYENARDLKRDADAAMYKAKAAGRSTFAVFNPTWHEEGMKRLRMESDLRGAIARQELSLVYQPIVSLETNQTLGFETLLRWKRRGENVSPAEFIPLAEDSGLIIEIGDWVMEEACRQLARWRCMPQAEGIFLSVNLSRKQLNNPHLSQRLHRILTAFGLPPGCIKLEVTESAMMEDSEKGLALLEHLRSMGIGLYMDDFGTGYSSLSCLHKFPLDGLKIDRAFINNAAGRRDYAAVIHAIVMLARNLNMRVVAEGVETPEQIALLQGLECEYAQGYYFSRPVSADGAEKILLNPPGLAKSA